MGDQIVCAGLIKKENEYILVKESKSEISGLWSLPAGRLEDDETLQQCVTREVEEESGICAKPSGIIGVYFNNTEDGITSIIVYDMKYISGNPHANHEDVQDAQWFSESEISDLTLRSQYINQAIDDYKTRDRIPCEYVERVEDLSPSKLAQIKSTLSRKRYNVDRSDKVISMIGIGLLIFILWMIRRIRKMDSKS